jgi:hypothetical protein
MTDRSADLRRESARCLVLAQTTVDPKSREELVHMAARLHDLANSVPADFDIVLQALNDQMSSAPPPVAQQQQQIRPKKKDE